MEALIYDIEIINAIPNRDGSRLEGITYCKRRQRRNREQQAQA